MTKRSTRAQTIFKARQYARIIIEQKCTLRAAAQQVGVAHNSVYRALKCLNEADPMLAVAVSNVLAHNKAVRHLRAGQATKENLAKRKELDQ